MAPSSAGSQPPFDRSDTGESEKRGQQGQAEDTPELYGPLDIERHVKNDGRTLIRYARREREDT